MRLQTGAFLSRWTRSRLIVTLLIAAIAIGSLPAYALASIQSSTNSAGFTVAVRVTPDQVNPGETVKLAVTTTSARSTALSNITVDIVNPDNQRIHRTTYNVIHLRGTARTNTWDVTIPASAKPGTYQVQVSMLRQFNMETVNTFNVGSQQVATQPEPTPVPPTPEPVVPTPEPVVPTPMPDPVPPTQEPVIPTPEPVVEEPEQPAPAPDPEPEPVNNPTTPTYPQGTTMQQMVDQAAAGSTITVPAGVYNETVFVTKPLTLKAQPGAIIDGGNRAFWIVATANDVTIDGFEMRGGNNWQYWGGITNSHNNVHYDRLTVQNSTLHGASYAAIATKLGNGHRVLNNTIYNNGALGVRLDSGRGHLVSGNTMYNNNPAHAFNSGWEAGGIKISGNYGGIHDTVIEHNEAYRNNGAGIWVDVDGNNITIRHNNTHHNSRSGITYELSFGGNIHDNRVWENGYGYHEWGWGAGILIQNSSTTRVANNTVAWNADGISVVSQNRGLARWNNVTGVQITNNTITLAHDGGWNTYAVAWLQDWNGILTNSNSNNRGSGNQYFITTNDGSDLRFRWGDNGYWRLSEYASSPGESNATYLTNAQKNQHLSSKGIPTTR